MLGAQEKFTIQELLAAIRPELLRTEGQLAREASSNLILNQPCELDLSALTTIDDPIQNVIYDFKSIILSDGTDANTYVYAIFGRPSAAKKPQKLWNNSAFNFGSQVPEITFFSPAQPGKKITAYLFRDAQVTTGQMILNGDVNIIRSSSFLDSSVVCVGGTCQLISAADATAKTVHVSNDTGDDIWVKGSNTATKTGRLILAGDSYEFQTRAALYAYTLASGTVGTVKET